MIKFQIFIKFMEFAKKNSDIFSFRSFFSGKIRDFLSASWREKEKQNDAFCRQRCALFRSTHGLPVIWYIYWHTQRNAAISMVILASFAMITCVCGCVGVSMLISIWTYLVWKSKCGPRKDQNSIGDSNVGIENRERERKKNLPAQS